MKKYTIITIFLLSFTSLSLLAFAKRDSRESKIFEVANQHAYIYNTTDATITPGSVIHFDSNGVISSNISHTPGDSKITINQAGTYIVNFIVQGSPADSFALFQNDTYVGGSSYEPTLNINEKVDKEFSQVIIQVNAGDVLTVKHYSPVRGQGNAFLKAAGKPSVNASVLIVQLSD